MLLVKAYITASRPANSRASNSFYSLPLLLSGLLSPPSLLFSQFSVIFISTYFSAKTQIKKWPNKSLVFSNSKLIILPSGFLYGTATSMYFSSSHQRTKKKVNHFEFSPRYGLVKFYFSRTQIASCFY